MEGNKLQHFPGYSFTFENITLFYDKNICSYNEMMKVIRNLFEKQIDMSMKIFAYYEESEAEKISINCKEEFKNVFCTYLPQFHKKIIRILLEKEELNISLILSNINNESISIWRDNRLDNNVLYNQRWDILDGINTIKHELECINSNSIKAEDFTIPMSYFFKEGMNRIEEKLDTIIKNLNNEKKSENLKIDINETIEIINVASIEKKTESINIEKSQHLHNFEMVQCQSIEISRESNSNDLNEIKNNIEVLNHNDVNLNSFSRQDNFCCVCLNLGNFPNAAKFNCAICDNFYLCNLCINNHHLNHPFITINEKFSSHFLSENISISNFSSYYSTSRKNNNINDIPKEILYNYNHLFFSEETSSIKLKLDLNEGYDIEMSKKQRKEIPIRIINKSNVSIRKNKILITSKNNTTFNVKNILINKEIKEGESITEILEIEAPNNFGKFKFQIIALHCNKKINVEPIELHINLLERYDKTYKSPIKILSETFRPALIQSEEENQIICKLTDNEKNLFIDIQKTKLVTIKEFYSELKKNGHDLHLTKLMLEYK